jgi:uncharacterized protein (TIGR02996 family)
MPDDEAFLRAVLADPDDDGPRLIYADWLEERGDVRGEFIALQCRLARLDRDDPARLAMAARVRQLLRGHEAEWARPLRGLADAWTFRRGFAEEVAVDARTFLAHAPALFQAAPVRRLKLLHVGRLRRRVAACPDLARLRELDLSGNFLGPVGGQLLTSANLARLEVLDLDGNAMGGGGMRALTAAALPGSLVELDLSFNGLRNAGAVALAEGPSLERLRVLRLARNGIGTAGALALAASPHLEALTTLDLRGNLPGTQGTAALRERFGPRVRL